MVGVCTICSVGTSSRSNPSLKCQGSCGGEFHMKCVKLPPSFSELSTNTGISWKCASCLQKNDSALLLDHMMQKMNPLFSSVAEIKKQNSEMVKSLEFYGGKIDDFTRKMEKFEETVKAVENTQNEVKMLREDNNRIRNDLEFLQQQGRMKNVEIRGVTEKRGENILSIIAKLCEIIDFKLERDDIDSLHRVNSFQTPNKSTEPRCIILTFTKNVTKNIFMQSAKSNREKLRAKLIDREFEDKPIYINEHLSPGNKVLYKKTRDLCATQNFKFCWIKDCKIFVKKADGDRVIQITNEDSLNKLRK
ncbi:unnamed protein product [Phaedon cochleariae]|uniref:PHD-type domain-containing protein n=1 Tax=Phaedon cochleariae TaxID=80249 RepID=A0A9P0DUZ6_PHACE|nr:unnamed protein product [Phaedon cochleariae]